MLYPQDGVGANRVVAEVPQFPIVNFHGNMWQNVAMYDEMWQSVATCAHVKQDITKCKGFTGPSVKNPFVPTTSGS